MHSILHRPDQTIHSNFQSACLKQPDIGCAYKFPQTGITSTCVFAITCQSRMQLTLPSPRIPSPKKPPPVTPPSITEHLTYTHVRNAKLPHYRILPLLIEPKQLVLRCSTLAVPAPSMVSYWDDGSEFPGGGGRGGLGRKGEEMYIYNVCETYERQEGELCGTQEKYR